MSRIGNCYDNAVIESFHASIKKEMIYLQGAISAKEMKLRVFDYIEGFYNRERLHSANENMSPLNFEKNTKKSEGVQKSLQTRKIVLMIIFDTIKIYVFY